MASDILLRFSRDMKGEDMVPTIEVTRPSNSESLEHASWSRQEGEMNDANDADAWADWDDGEKRKSDVTIDDLESSVSGFSSETGDKKTAWEERMKWWKVYALHFLFMWNSRTFEYVSIFLVASAFPGSLKATSIKGITSTVSGLLFSSAVGNWIDRSPSRLRTLLITICFNHAAVVVSYICWLSFPIPAEGTTDAGSPFSSFHKGMVFGIILLLDIIHDLGAIGNRLSLERDWVPVLVGHITPNIKYGLTEVNSVMTRIDLVCKLVAPSLLPVIISALNSRTAWILVLIVLTAVFWTLEVWCARIIAGENSELDVLKLPSHDSATEEDLVIEDRYNYLKPGFQSLPQKIYFILYQDPSVRLRHYFSIPMWPASIASALLQLTVLAYSATLITYTLEIGFSLSSITIARASGAIMALSSTVITPALVGHMRKRLSRNRGSHGENREKADDELEGKAVRTVGLWGISFQFVCLTPIVLLLWNLSPKSSVQAATAPVLRAASTYDTNKTASLPPIIPITLFAFLSISRVGHYMIHLMVQELGQVEIPASQRSTFAGTEQSFNSLFALCHWAATVGWSRPDQFRYLALGSFLICGVGVGVFAWWQKKPARRNGAGYESIVMGDVYRGDENDED